MKVAGLLLLLSGWIIVLAALVLIPSAAPRSAFVASGVGVELLGLFLLLRSNRRAGMGQP